jgi:cardiolipin synthase A/B
MPVRTPPATTTPGSPSPAQPSTTAPLDSPAVSTDGSPLSDPAVTNAADDTFDGHSSGSIHATAPTHADPANPAHSALGTRLGAMLGSSPASFLTNLPDLDTPAGQAALLKQFETLFQQVSQDPALRAQTEKELIQGMALLSSEGQLKPGLAVLAEAAKKTGALPPMTTRKQTELVEQLAGMIEAELSARGMTPSSQGTVYETWEELSKKHLALVRDTVVGPAGPGQPSAFLNPAFLKELESLQGSPFLEGNAVKPLIDGPASFAERSRLFENAKTSINLMSWAFYDDDTGWKTAKQLVKKAQEGVKVRIIVDGQVAARSHHHETLDHMEANGVEIVRWRNPNRLSDGQHRKVMIVDGTEAIAGGMNVGDVYSHGGPAGEQKWRDTDVLIQGPAVNESSKLFFDIWNEQIQTHNLNYATVDVDAVDSQDPLPGESNVAVVNHSPGPDGDAHILLATLKAIEGATESVDIENAYFIQTPALREALLSALARGVKVRLLTNSGESVDEPIVSAPILASLPELCDAGAEIYLKKGDTLHSKFMVVDGLFTSVGSYNLHPRSHRYEGELTMNMLGRESAETMGDAFAKDIADAIKVNKGKDIVIPQSAFTHLASRYFFDQL